MPTKRQIHMPSSQASHEGNTGDVNSASGAEAEVNAATSRVDEPKARKRKRGISAASRKQQTPFIDLTGVPPQPLILKNAIPDSGYADNSRRRPIKAGSSKYTGVYYDLSVSGDLSKKWKAQIMVDGAVRSIGYYNTEKGAAADYARAAYKYKPKKKNESMFGGLDLSNVPDQPLIRGNTSCGYKSVKKLRERWQARINIGGKHKTLGTFDTAEEAAAIYARALHYLSSKGEE